MAKAKDLTGQRFGKLTALCQGDRIRNLIAWKCLCDCGNSKLVVSQHLTNHSVRSCGCLKTEQLKSGIRQTKHGMQKTPTYTSWQSMKTRCSNPNFKHYHRYGGRGISYPSEWEVFDNFYKDMGVRPEGTTLERLDNDKGYSKENCVWATRKEQARNTTTTIKIKHKDQELCMLDWANNLDIPYTRLRTAIKNGKSIDQILRSSECFA